MTEVKNRVADWFLVDTEEKPQAQTNNIHYEDNRKYTVKVTLFKYNSSGDSNSGSNMVALVIYVGAVIWLLSMVGPLLAPAKLFFGGLGLW